MVVHAMTGVKEMMMGTSGTLGDAGPSQEQTGNKLASLGRSDWSYADLLLFPKYGQHCIQGMTRAGILFLVQHSSDTLVSLTPDVWALKAAGDDDEILDALIENLDTISGEQGLMLRIAP